MARLPRFELMGHPQHVIVRGNNREPIFYADEDYQYYLEKLNNQKGRARLILGVLYWLNSALKK
jgi:REP element-mobilizing transposase RayT